MDLTFAVTDMLKLDAYSEAVLLSGRDGLQNEITGITIIEDLTIEEWLRGGEVLVTGLSPFSGMSDTETQAFFSGLLSRKSVAALIVKVGKAVNEVPHFLVQMGDQFTIPVIQIPRSKPYIDIVHPTFAEILNQQYRKLAYFEQTHRNFRDLSLKNASQMELLDRLEFLIGNPVVLTDKRFHVLYQSQHFPQEVDFEPLKEISKERHRIGSGKHLSAALKVGGALLTALTFEVVGVMDIRSYVTVLEVNKTITDLDYIAIETACTNLSLRKTTDYLVHKTEQRFMNDVVTDLLLGNITQESNLISRSNIAGMNLSCPYVVAVLHFNDALPDRQPNNLYEVVDMLMQPFEGIYCLRGSSAVLLLEQNEPEINPRKTVEKIKKSLIALQAQVKEQYRLQFAAGIGNVVDGYKELSTSYNNAMQAHDLGKEIVGNHAVVSFDELGIYKLLHDFGDKRKLNEYIPPSLITLMEYDRNKKSNLVATLDCYLSKNQHYAMAAEQLFVHPKTIQYRISKVKELTDMDFSDAEEIMQVSIGLRIIRFMQSK